MSRAICPECRQGKHANCTLTTLDPETDDFVHCACSTDGHGAEKDVLPCCRGEGPCQAPPDIGPCDPLPIVDALPELDRHALVMADLAWIETEGSQADRTEAAIRAYLWAVQIADRDGLYPSLNQWRETRPIPPEGGDDRG